VQQTSTGNLDRIKTVLTGKTKQKKTNRTTAAAATTF
jgi:hypothetical protein